MRLLASLLLLVIAIPSADAAVIAATKQKNLPTIGSAYVNDDLNGFGFVVTKAPTTQAYDTWARITGGRNQEVAEWFVKSMKLRSRAKKLAKPDFKGDIADILFYTKPGTYVLTLFACPANTNDPTEKGCAHASVSVVWEGR